MMKFKSIIFCVLMFSTQAMSNENFDEYTVFSGNANLRMSLGEKMQQCKLNCTQTAKESALYNYFLENYPNHTLNDQQLASLISTIIDNVHSVEVHHWQHVMNGPASIDITFSVNTAFLNEMESQYFQD